MRPDVEGMKRWLQEFNTIEPDDATDLVVYAEELEAQLAAKDERIAELVVAVKTLREALGLAFNECRACVPGSRSIACSECECGLTILQALAKTQED